MVYVRDLTCNCVGTYYGDHCENQCKDSENCSGNGMCLHNGRCLCNEGFQGENCADVVTMNMDGSIVYILLLLIILTLQVYCFYKQTVCLLLCFDM